MDKRTPSERRDAEGRLEERSTPPPDDDGAVKDGAPCSYAGPGSLDQWLAIGALVEPTRRAVYGFVQSADGPVSRESVSGGLHITKAVAVTHLERLTEVGLLTVHFQRPSGRGGPGAGRPTKFYTATNRDLAATWPPRRYELVARIMSLAASEMGGSESDVLTVARSIARHEGRSVVATDDAKKRMQRDARYRGLDGVLTSLLDLGYEPRRTEDGSVCLSNCPFHALSAVAPEVVCVINQQFLLGVLEAYSVADEAHAVLDSPPNQCCVTIHVGGASDRKQARSD